MKIFKNFINKRILIGVRKNKILKKDFDVIKLQKGLLREIEKENNFNYKFGIFLELSAKQIMLRSYQIVASMIIVRLSAYIFFFSSFNLGLVYPLPKKYLKVIESNGIKINYFLSNLFCKALLFIKLFHSFIIIFFFIKKLLFNIKKDKNIYSKKSIFFLSLPTMFTNKNKLIIDQKLVSEIFQLDIEKIYLHNKFNQINHEKKEFYPNINILIFIKFFKYSVLSILNSKKINYFLCLKFKEIIETIFFKYSNDRSVYKNIVFSEEYRFAKPLWSYYLETLKWNILFINYSTNHYNQIKFYPNEYKSAEYRYFSFIHNVFPTQELLNFYIEKSDYMRGGINIVSKDIFNLINKFNKKLIKRKIITIYDIRNLPRYTYEDKPWGFYYYKSSIINDFYSEILECLNNFNDLIIIIKRKPISSNHLNKFDKNFQKIIEKKVNKKNRLFIIENVNIFKMIKKTDLAVTIPFSSPSIIANFNKIPSVYYDTTGSLKDPFNNQFPKFINNKEGLLKFLRNFLKNA